jgi:hypothetical protein
MMKKDSSGKLCEGMFGKKLFFPHIILFQMLMEFRNKAKVRFSVVFYPFQTRK